MGGFDTLLQNGSAAAGGSETLTLINQSKEIINRTKTDATNEEGEFDENYEYEDEISQDQSYYTIRAL